MAIHCWAVTFIPHRVVVEGGDRQVRAAFADGPLSAELLSSM